MGPLARWGAVGLGLLALMVDAALLVQWRELIILCTFVAASTVGVALSRAACALIVRWALRDSSGSVQSMIRRRLLLPLIGLGLCIAAIGEGGMAMRVYVSHPWIASAVRAANAFGPGTCDTRTRPLGLFRVYSINVGRSDTYVYVRSRSGLEYLAISYDAVDHRVVWARRWH